MSGRVHLVRRGNGFLVINRVDVEEYVKGVVPAEVSSAWHPEMLKAQAVAARTYALYQQMLSATREYDVVATVQDQVYRGKQGVDAGILRAVEETRGLVVTYQDAPIYAAFSSTAAGLTEDAMNVWSKEYPYLKGVECPFDLMSPYYQWKSSFKIDTLEQNLRAAGVFRGYDRVDDAFVVQPRRASCHAACSPLWWRIGSSWRRVTEGGWLHHHPQHTVCHRIDRPGCGAFWLRRGARCRHVPVGRERTG